MKTLILARHGHSLSNVRDVVSSSPPGEGLSDVGVADALGLHEAVAAHELGLGVASRLARAQETLAVALGERDVPRVVVPELDDIDFGQFEGGPLSEYRAWAWASSPETPCPGGGESRVDAALRLARALDILIAREEGAVLAVSHGLPIRYVVEGALGRFPPARIGRIPHATAFTLSRDEVALAAVTLRHFAAEPRFADAPDGA